MSGSPLLSPSSLTGSGAAAATAVGGGGGSSLTIPEVLAQGPALHALARVELTNGSVVVGRITAMEPLTMNMKLDGLRSAQVIREHVEVQATGTSTDPSSFSSSSGVKPKTTRRREVEVHPIPLRCLSSVVVRGSHVRYIDFLSEEEDRRGSSDGGTALESLIAAVQSVGIGGG